jgi:hypothetical protein
MVNTVCVNRLVARTPLELLLYDPGCWDQEVIPIIAHGENRLKHLNNVQSKGYDMKEKAITVTSLKALTRKADRFIKKELFAFEQNANELKVMGGYYACHQF